MIFNENFTQNEQSILTTFKTVTPEDVNLDKWLQGICQISNKGKTILITKGFPDNFQTTHVLSASSCPTTYSKTFTATHSEDGHLVFGLARKTSDSKRKIYVQSGSYMLLLSGVRYVNGQQKKRLFTNLEKD